MTRATMLGSIIAPLPARLPAGSSSHAPRGSASPAPRRRAAAAAIVLPKAETQRSTSATPCSASSAGAERDQHLERPDRHARGAVDARLADPHRFVAVAPARDDERQHAGEEEDDVEHQLHRRLGARAPQAVEHVGAHVAAARERVGAGHVEHRAVHQVAHVERPAGGLVQDVAHEHLVRGAEGEDHQAPGEGVPDGPAQQVDAVDEAVNHGHGPSATSRKWGGARRTAPVVHARCRAPAQAGILVLNTCS